MVIRKGKVGTTETGWLNVRENPSLNSLVIIKINEGDGVECSDENEEWLKVKLESGEEGWVSKKYIEMADYEE